MKKLEEMKNKLEDSTEQVDYEKIEFLVKNAVGELESKIEKCFEVLLKRELNVIQGRIYSGLRKAWKIDLARQKGKLGDMFEGMVEGLKESNNG